MKKLIVLFMFLFLLACASAWGYEIHPKNGAVIKGDQPSALNNHSLPPALENHSLLPHPVKGFAAITSLSHSKKGFKGHDK